ncbi:hypothetical protein [Shinella zoogloeoides]|uniref:hypothetical protein n=1 Tax=Shinella zoogloeoides TaxID=352475 RepID=UPI00299D4B11|nr:hypothetical protein [Shinella zoogloeoides]WPE19898.1 hypothetical protein ShzoTeo12_10740 [Shinella zoogloeoides]
MSICEFIKIWYAGRGMRRIVREAASHYHRTGAPAPYALAVHEAYLRRKLEDFRQFAGRRYLEDRALTLEEIKQEWLDLVVKPMAMVDITQNDAKALKAAILAITDTETFTGPARRARDSDVAAAIFSARRGDIYRGHSS